MVVSDIFRTFVPVNEKVTDISDALQTMADEMRLMRETIASQHSDICQLNRNIDRLNADLRKRDKRIEELEAEFAKYKYLGYTQAPLTFAPDYR